MQHNLISLFSRNKAVSKILSCCAVFVFVFVLSAPVFVNAMAPVPVPIPQISVPIGTFNNAGLEENYDLLSDEQEDIADEIMGTYLTMFSGLGLYRLVNGLVGTGPARQQLRNFGHTFINSFFETTYANPRGLGDLVGSVTHKASTYEDYSEYESETTTGSSYYLEYNPDLTIQFRDWYFNRGGLYQWQFVTRPFSSSVSWNVYPSANISGVLINEYNSYVSSNLSSPILHLNYNYSSGSTPYRNCLCSSSILNEYHNMFIDTVQHRVYLVDDSGNQYLNRVYFPMVCYSGSSYDLDHPSYARYYANQQYAFLNPLIYYTASSYSTYIDLVRDIYDFVLPPYNSPVYVYYEDFVQHVYVGANWSQRQEIFNIDDLNIADTTSNYIDNVGDTSYVDATGVIDDIAAGDTNLQQVVVDNTLVKDGTEAIPLTTSLLKAIDKYISEPLSDVSLDPDIFSPLFGEQNDGYIWYLWSMTKPLVLYTRDFLHTLLFNGKGIAWIVYGVVSVGLIGGLVVKFLL